MGEGYLKSELHCYSDNQQPLLTVGINTLYVVAILVAGDYLKQLDVCILLTERQKVKL